MGAWGAWGHAGPSGPTGPGEGSGGDGDGPPPGPPPLPPGGTVAAILNTQHNSKSNLTLLVNNWLINNQLSAAYANI